MKSADAKHIVNLVVLMVLLTAVSWAESTVPTTAVITDCQLLMSETEVQSQGIARQRSMYPASSRQRISDQAVRDGFNAATRKEAMREFNRAWRFNPENPLAYWGAAIVKGCEALKYGNDKALAGKCWQDSIMLFEKGDALPKAFPPIQKCEYQIDMAVACRDCARFLQKESTDKAKALLEKAEAIFLQYHPCSVFQPEQNRRINLRVVWEMKELYSVWGKSDEMEKCHQEFLKLTTEQERKMLSEANKKTKARWAE